MVNSTKIIETWCSVHAKAGDKNNSNPLNTDLGITLCIGLCILLLLHCSLSLPTCLILTLHPYILQKVFLNIGANILRKGVLGGQLLNVGAI